jgi:hypothetical protein
MSYEWDAAKARRVYLVKFAAVCLMTLTVSGVPVWFAMKAGAF